MRGRPTHECVTLSLHARLMHELAYAVRVLTALRLKVATFIERHKKDLPHSLLLSLWVPVYFRESEKEMGSQRVLFVTAFGCVGSKAQVTFLNCGCVVQACTKFTTFSCFALK